MKIQRRGLLYILSSPSGAGKTTISRALLETDNNLILSISVTTRPPRPGEVNGTDYIFVCKDTFSKMIEQGAFLEYAKVFDNYYGTPKAPVEDALRQGKDVFFDIDWQGGQQLAEKMRDDVVKVFVLPPSTYALEKRLRSRAQDTDDVVRARMAKSADEMSHYPEYDWVIVNTNLDTAVVQARAILESERLKRNRQNGLTDFVKKLRQGY